MKVLITGAFGYFGTALRRRLAAEHKVFAVGRTAAATLEARDVADTEAIVHLAGGGAPGGHSPDPRAAHCDNVESALRILAIAAPGTRLILASTIYVYGTGSRPFVESDDRRPDTLYGQLKAVAEAVWRQHGGVALRFSHIYGPGGGPARDGVTERLARAAAGWGTFQLHGNGRQGIDLVHIDDACEAVALALRGKDLPPAVNIGGGAAVSVAHLARVFLGGMPPMELPVVERALDITLAQEALGWAPRVTLPEGARRLIAQTKEAQR